MSHADHLLVILAALQAVLLALIFYSALGMHEALNEMLGEITAMRIANEIGIYEEDVDEPGMIERLDDWLIQQESDRIVADILANAHIVEEETDGGTSWGRVE